MQMSFPFFKKRKKLLFKKNIKMLKFYISVPGLVGWLLAILVYDAGSSNLQNEGQVETRETITPVPSLVSLQARIYNLLAEEL